MHQTPPSCWSVALSVLALAGTSSAQGRIAPNSDRPNIVLVVLDDIGVDKLGVYGEGPQGAPTPCTPNLDMLAGSGLIFRNAWTNAICSPTRAQILTGRHSFRTGIGGGIPPDGRRLGLRVDLERMLPRELLGYESSAIGKWHLMSPSNGNTNHPLEAGFGYFSGSLFNLVEAMAIDPVCNLSEPLGYTNWIRYEGSAARGLSASCYSDYATSVTADEAIGRAHTMQEPWFLYVAFQASHAPFEPPPGNLCSPFTSCFPNYCPPPSNTSADVADSMIEVLDSEFGRMMAGIRAAAPDTYVFVIGDNGTDGSASRAAPGECFDPARSKGTLYEAGINVPLIAAGPGVIPGECNALVNSTDLFATVLELSGLPSEAEDSISLVPYLRGNMRPRRSSVYAELFVPNQPSSLEGYTTPPSRHIRTIRDERFKLIRWTKGGQAFEEFYDLAADPCEQINLCPGMVECTQSGLTPNARAHYLALRAQLAAMGVY